jgi:SAM-dependent methyltransferase
MSKIVPSLNRIDIGALQAILARHVGMYRAKAPYYQAAMLNALLELWQGRHHRLLDIGSGTGVIAQAVAELFPVDSVAAVDRVDRFCPSLSIPAQRYDGRTLPFADGHFDAAMLNNVLHHVPVEARTDLLREIRRAVDGPLYIKDHESRCHIDVLRLTVLDAIGNIPFGGVLWARYLERSEWENLAAAAGYRIAARVTKKYRSGLFAVLFPNRLETTMRFEPIGNGMA